MVRDLLEIFSRTRPGQSKRQGGQPASKAEEANGIVSFELSGNVWGYIISLVRSFFDI